MKKYLLILAIAAVMFPGCNPEDDPVTVKSPKIAIKVENDVPVIVYPGTDLDFVFSLNHEAGIRSVYATVDGEAINGSEKSYSDSPKSVTFNFSYRPSDKYAGNTIDFAVVAEGTDGAKGHFDYPVFILAAKPDVVITFPDDIPNEFLVDGSALEFPVLIKSGSIDMAQVTTYKGETVLPDMSFDTLENPREMELWFSYIPTPGDAGKPTVFTVEVMDVNGNFISANYSVTFIKPVSTELNEFTGVTMGMNRCTSDGQFFDAVNNKVYSAVGVGAHCADIDLATFWSNNANTQGAAFAAPIATNVASIYPEATIVNVLGGAATDIPANWATRNETNFREVDLDADAFASVMTKQDLYTLFDTAEPMGNDHVVFRKTGGSTFVFKINRTAASTSGEMVKYGIIRVTSRPATNNTGIIIFDYKIEK